jgi:ribosomal protein L17
MADGDIVRLGIAGPYCKAYRMLCEGMINTETCARAAARGVGQFIKWYGSEPRQLLHHMAEQFSKVSNQLGPLSPSQAVALAQEIERISRKLGGDKRGMSIAMAACRSKLNSLRQGESVENISKELSQQYVDRIAEATFTSVVISRPRHYDNAPATTVKQRLEDILPDLKRNLEGYAQQLGKSTNVDKAPRLLRRQGPKPIINRNTKLA